MWKEKDPNNWWSFWSLNGCQLSWGSEVANRSFQTLKGIHITTQSGKGKRNSILKKRGGKKKYPSSLSTAFIKMSLKKKWISGCISFQSAKATFTHQVCALLKPSLPSHSNPYDSGQPTGMTNKIALPWTMVTSTWGTLHRGISRKFIHGHLVFACLWGKEAQSSTFTEGASKLSRSTGSFMTRAGHEPDMSLSLSASFISRHN